MIYPSGVILLLPHPSQISFLPSPPWREGKLYGHREMLWTVSPQSVLSLALGWVQTMEDIARRFRGQKRGQGIYPNT